MSTGVTTAYYYASSLGRFISADMAVPDGKNPQQFNRYTEEAMAETRAQLMTGGTLKDGLMFPLINNYGISPLRVAAEGSVVTGGVFGISILKERAIKGQ